MLVESEYEYYFQIVPTIPKTFVASYKLVFMRAMYVTIVNKADPRNVNPRKLHKIFENKMIHMYEPVNLP
jgi:hypothetical protein